MTRYDKITLDYVVEFAGPGTDVVEPTPEQCADPRFLAWLEWLQEVRMPKYADAGNVMVL